jgi:hypothetical protein
MAKFTTGQPSDPVADPTDEALTSVIAGRAGGNDRGDGQFQAVAGGEIRCLTCRQRFGADTQRADDIDRVEGASDPADMAMVLPVRCPHCDTTGSLVLRYGPEASEDESDLLVALRREPADRGRPPSAAATGSA